MQSTSVAATTRCASWPWWSHSFCCVSEDNETLSHGILAQKKSAASHLALAIIMPPSNGLQLVSNPSRLHYNTRLRKRTGGAHRPFDLNLPASPGSPSGGSHGAGSPPRSPGRAPGPANHAPGHAPGSSGSTVPAAQPSRAPPGQASRRKPGRPMTYPDVDLDTVANIHVSRGRRFQRSANQKYDDPKDWTAVANHKVPTGRRYPNIFAEAPGPSTPLPKPGKDAAQEARQKRMRAMQNPHSAEAAQLRTPPGSPAGHLTGTQRRPHH